MHLHISGIDGIITILYVIAIMGALNLLAMRFAGQSSLAATWCNTFGLTA
jgi:hypothetical protein